MPLITLPSTRAVIRAQAALQDAGIDVAVVPLPASVSAQCGMGLKVEPNDVERTMTILNNLDLKYKIEYEW